jgi:hypothetical protein
MEFSYILSGKTILYSANIHTTAFPKRILVQEINFSLLKWISAKYTLYITVIFNSVSTLARYLCTHFSSIYRPHQNVGYICRQGCATTFCECGDCSGQYSYLNPSINRRKTTVARCNTNRVNVAFHHRHTCPQNSRHSQP